MQLTELFGGWSLAIAPYAIVLFGAALLCVLLAANEWQHGWKHSGRIFAVFMLATAIWALFYGLELVAPAMWAKVFWAKVEFLGIAPLPAVWFLFSRTYTGPAKRLGRGALALLAGIPALTVLLAFTNEWHGLVWRGVYLRDRGAFSVLALDRGPWLWFFIGCAYAALAVGGFLVVRGLWRCPRVYRFKLALVLLAAVVPMVANGVSVSGFIPATGIDFTPVALAVTGLVFSVGLSQARVISTIPWLLPYARSRVLSGMRDAVLVLDENTRVVSANNAGAAMFGLSTVGMLGRQASEFLGDGIDLRLPRDEVQSQFEWERGSGESRRVYDVSADLLSLSGGLGMGHVLVARDVTERRRAERLMKEQEAQLIQAQKMEAVGRLAGGVAHDFNNLLMVVLGNSQLLLAGMRSDDPNRCLVEEILQAGEKGAALNRQILTFSRRQVLEAQSVLLDDVVAGLEPLLRRIVGSGIELVFHLAAGPTPVEIDPPQMEQAILNLAINARDAMPSGGRLTIETLTASCEPPAGAEPSPAATEGDVLLRVTDTGTGMDEQTMAHIFEPFFTTKDPGQGTGLGLSTVFGIVKQSGGTISVASEPGWGTRFEICLPAGTPKDREESPGAEVAKTPEQPPYVVVEA